MLNPFKRTMLAVGLAAVFLLAALPPLSCSAENLRFVFVADSRGDSIADLINMPVVNAINNQILALSPRPVFVMFGGDQAYAGSVYGRYTFQAFKNAMAPLTNAGIPWYTVMGNHEICDSTNANRYLLANQRHYQQAFTNNPANGPSPDYDRLVYSFESPGGDVFFAVLDQYFLTADAPANLSGTIDAAQLAWLRTKVAATKAKHKILFMHGPYYYIDFMPPPPDITYTHLWKILDDNRFVLYCCGHNHLYSRKTIDSSIPPLPQTTPPIRWKNNVVQLLTGTAGAPIDPYIMVDPVAWNVHCDPNTFYFSVVDINGSRVTVKSYQGNTGAYTVFDSFTINKNSAGPGSDLLLLQ